MSSTSRFENMLQMISLSCDQIEALKRVVTNGATYADRISLGFALRLAMLDQERREASNVLHEIAVLEGLGGRSATQSASQFKHPPLHPFWHKHFFTSRHLLRNIGNRWGIHPEKMAKKHKALDTMIAQVASEFGDDPDIWQKRLVYEFGIASFEERASEGRLTGDWIIFGMHDGRRYYLDIAQHTENDEALYNKLRNSSEAEFPFLFGD